MFATRSRPFSDRSYRVVLMRGRSKSLVQSIASDIPNPYDSPKHEVEPKLQKSSSIPDLKHLKPITKLHPFNKKETQILENQLFELNFDLDVLELEDFAQRDPQIDNFMTALDLNITQLHNYQRMLGTIFEQLDDVENKYLYINQSTGDFSKQSLALMKKEQEMNEKYQSINLILKNFENLNQITEKLSIPSTSKLIKSKTFNKILNDLNSSLNFINIEDFKDFKNIDTYKIKFRQCMTRVLTIIKDYLVKELRKIEAGIKSSTNNDQELINISVYAEFDGYKDSFNDVYYNFPNLIDIFMKRIVENDEVEYQGLLMEVFRCYFQIRLGLIQFDDWKFDTVDLIKFTQDNLSVIKKLLHKELNCFKNFFGINDIPEFISELIYGYFKDLTEPFYDTIRLKILKEQNIESLCQLTTLLQNYYEYEESTEEINLQEILNPILNNVQSRLIFRIQLYIDNKLLPYKPTPDDLKMGHTKKLNNLNEEFQDNLFPELYLPLGKALTILSNIYELINSVVFDDLAHYIVHNCIQILQNSLKVSESNLGKINSKLFYLKNLIILKVQLNNFDIKFIRNDYSIDFTSGFNDLYNVIRNGEILVTLNSGVFELIKKSLPKIINNMIDAKLEIELEINNLINELLKDFLNSIIEDLPDFNQFKLSIPTKLESFKKQIIAYLNDLNLLKILFNNLSELLINYYFDYYRGLKDQIDFMEPDTFTRYVSDIIDDLINDDNLQNNLMDIKPLLKFDEELDEMMQTPTKSNGNILDGTLDSPTTGTPDIHTPTTIPETSDPIQSPSPNTVPETSDPVQSPSPNTVPETSTSVSPTTVLETPEDSLSVE